ncbi:hypothetical protein VSR87_25995, partial [Klebsiella pneumoniae]|uniref:hypothetical protein n=1 Tax=Klebsiella pneumoniae TaxID=573 RepID=UPI002DB5BFF3
VTTYRHDFNGQSRLTASLALTANETNIARTRDTPAELQEGTANRVLLIDTVSIGLIERAQPRQKALFSVSYQLGKLTLTPRLSYFGSVTAYERSQPTGPRPAALFTCPISARSSTPEPCWTWP